MKPSSRTQVGTKQCNGDHSKIICFKCSKPSHKASECRTKTQPAKQDARKAQEISFLSAKEIAHVASANAWCLDSGSTSYMCSSIQKFDVLKEPSQRRLNLANNASASIDGTESVSIDIQNGNEAKTIKLKDILYVPELRTDLLSISKIAGTV